MLIWGLQSVVGTLQIHMITKKTTSTATAVRYGYLDP